MAQHDFKIGSSKLEDFYAWMNERHRIYVKRAAGEPKPWTEDELLLDYKFTNVFRQLDRGTIALKDMLDTKADDALVLFNIVWYRCFNLDTHAKNLGFVYEYGDLHDYVKGVHKRGEKVFTSAHMVYGREGWIKADQYLHTSKLVWDEKEELVGKIFEKQSLEYASEELREFPNIGFFTAYEIACDLRFTPIMEQAKDIYSWANLGPGAKRGLERLGLLPNKNGQTWVDWMVWLYKEAIEYLGDHIVSHHPDANDANPDAPCWAQEYPPFELREIEHSLCEFDKYERVRCGEGRPRQRFNGRA